MYAVGSDGLPSFSLVYEFENDNFEEMIIPLALSIMLIGVPVKAK